MQAKVRQEERLWIFCDGGMAGVDGDKNLGMKMDEERSRAVWRKYFRTEIVATAAAVARDQRGRIVDWRWQRLGAVSNNEAEYAGLLLGLELGLAYGVTELFCIMDSEVVVGQMRGYFAVNSATLRAWHWQACTAARRIAQVHYCLVPREWNRLADGLASQAMMPWRDLALAIEAFNAEIFL